MTSVTYSVLPRTNSPVQFNWDGQTAESQSTPRSQQFNGRQVALIIGAITAIGVVVAVVAVFQLWISNNENTVKPNELADRTVTAAMNTIVTMVKNATQSASSSITETMQSLTENPAGNPVNCNIRCGHVDDTICANNGKTYRECVLDKLQCQGDIAKNVTIAHLGPC